MTTQTPRTLRAKPLGYWLLSLLFPPVYALTVMPFTVRFFRNFVTPPATDVLLFNWLPLTEVHQFFLPLFVLALELIGIRVAAGFFNEVGALRKLLLLAIFLGFQAFPTFSVYYDARSTEYANVVASNEATKQPDAEEAQRVEREYQSSVDKYNQDLGLYNTALTNWQADKDRLQKRINDLQAAIDKSSEDQKAALQRARVPNTVAEREAAKTEADRLGKQMDQYRTDQASAQQELQKLIANPPTAPSSPAPLVLPAPKAKPLPYTSDVDFVFDTAGSRTADLEIAIALIFPIVVFGAGYLLSRFGRTPTEQSERQFGALDISRELRICGKLRNARAQAAFVEGLKPVVAGYFTNLKAFGKYATTRTAFELENEREMEMLEAFSSLQEQILTSNIEGRAQEELRQYVEQLLETQTFQRTSPLQSQPAYAA